MGLVGATGVGVGAIVGGGILALAGVAFSVTGPGAILAFALNGVIALLTALSFAEMSAAFPESGGTYTFAKRVLSVRVAFGVGWVVWFASLVAAVLYALGFAAFASLSLQALAGAWLGPPPAWLGSRWLVSGLAAAATLGFALGLLRRSGGGGQWINVTKSAVFAIVIAGGLAALGRTSGAEVVERLTPFLAQGAGGLFEAMGFTFIALQGFDLIAAAGGEVRDPARNLPRAMILSLLIALGIYLPLLFVVSVAGVAPGESITQLGREEPEAVIAIAARRFLGEFGYWLVVGAAILSMLSALRANLFAASRVAFAMARDRTLPAGLGGLDPARQVPRHAVLAVVAIVLVVLAVVPDVATAGAVSSLIFLVTFCVAHAIDVLLRHRVDPALLPFRTPAFPAVPAAGGVSCLALAVYQGIEVPLAGAIALAWLALGAGLYAWRFSFRARAFDASAEAVNPELLRSRGRSPLVLVPVEEADKAASLVAVANAISPPGSGRVLLLSVVQPPLSWQPDEPPGELLGRGNVLSHAVTASYASGLAPEALLTVSPNHWKEILRVARAHACESILLGLRDVAQQAVDPELHELLSLAPCDVVLLRAPGSWRFQQTRRILVPIGGKGRHSPLRARLLGSLRRTSVPECTYLCLLAASASAEELRRARGLLGIRADDEMDGRAEIEVARSADPAAEVIRRAGDYDLVVLGVQQLRDRRRMLGDFIARIARDTDCALVILGHRM